MASTTKTRAVAYLRVSTGKQVEEGVSIEAQEAKVRAYASLYDLELVAIEVDAGLSAKTLDRPGLQSALSSLVNGSAEAILVVKLDRLTRSVKDLGILLETYFSNGRYALMSVSEQIDTRSAAGRLILNVLASVSQWERETTGERTKAAMSYKKSVKEFTGGHSPYGWQVAEDGIHIEPNQAEQEILKSALELKAFGLSLRKIGQRLESAGLLPRSGGQWHAKTIQNLLDAEVA